MELEQENFSHNLSNTGRKDWHIGELLSKPGLKVVVHVSLLLAIAVAIPSIIATHADAQTSFTFNGSGWGHRLGLSQYGAYGQALEGASWGEIIHHYYGAEVQAVSTTLPSIVRVGIAQNQSGADISGSGSYVIGAGEARWAAGTGTWKIRPESSGMRLESPGGESWSIATNSVWIAGYEERGTVITIGQVGREYGRGWIDVIRKSNSTVNIVVETSYDKYLYGLGEMPSSWPPAALQAQAIAARTYAYYKHVTSGDRRAGCDCTVYGSTIDQAYVGWSKESGVSGSDWVAAVDYTSGVAILSAGRPILALYHSSSGGRTEAKEDVWGGSSLHYLQPMPDPWSNRSPHASWTVTFTSRELGRHLGLDEVFSVDISSRTMGGGVASAIVTGSRAGRSVTRTYSGTDFRTLLGLRSTMVYTGRPRGFDQWLLLLNPQESAVRTSISFERSGSLPVVRSFSLPARSRTTVKVNDHVSRGEVSIRVTASAPIVAERALYFVHGEWSGGASGEGARSPSLEWVLAEGYQGRSFDTYIEVYNPQIQPANATVEFLLEGGANKILPITVPARGRITLPAFGVAGLNQKSFSVRVRSDRPVVAERSSYFKYMSPSGWGSMEGGSASLGVERARTNWSLAEGHSGPGFDTWTLVANPGPVAASVTAKYLTDDGRAIVQNFEIPPYSRHTTNARSIPGLEGHSHSVQISSSAPVVAERAMYFRYRQLSDGHTAQAASNPETRWFLAEGHAGPGFDTWILISNSSTQRAAVKVTVLTEDGQSIVREIMVAPGSRRTINLYGLVGPVSASTIVESINGVGIVVERASYFSYDSHRGWKAQGGSSSMGVSESSTSWFFAEGYLS